VLRAMRRPYTAGMYAQLVERLARARPGLGLGADVIVGHPGETGGDFEATAALVEALPFSYLHVFPYSDRRGTEAASLTGRVDSRVAADRARRLRGLARRKNLAFRQALVGTTQEALILETRDATGRLVGLTGNYVEVALEGPDTLMRTLRRVRVDSAGEDETLGEWVA
jgi:threonylcarbamoyladenosine tRNA methylthiotransferase MtaB